MLSDRQTEYLQDMVDAARLAQRYVEDLDEAQFRGDTKSQHAVLYALLIVSEAAKRLSHAPRELLPDIPWEKVRALGNHLRHGYDKIDMGVIWQVVRADLGPLIAECERSLAPRGRRRPDD